MAKKFNIHEWQAKQWLKNQLNEQDDFTPDLEDDELKRSKIQQMMAKEKIPTGGDEKLRSAVEAIADMYSYGEILDAIESFYIKNDEQKSAEMARKHAKEFRAMLDDKDEDEMFMGDWGPHLAEEDLDENMTGTGASMQAGEGMGHFGKSKKKRANTPSGDMAYTQNVNENEEEPAVDDQGNPIEEPAEEEVVDTATELASQMKSIAGTLKTPDGARGLDKKEVEMFSILINSVIDALKNDNATSLLTKLTNLVK